MIDVHCHLDEIEEVLELLKEAKNKMTAIITSVVEPKKAQKIFRIRENFKDFLFISLGFHPENLKNYKEKEIEDYAHFIREKRDEISAIGEVGLDYSPNCKEISEKKQKEVFIFFIELAKSLNLPLVIHAREAFSDVLEILKEKKAEKVCLHCFSGSEGNLKEALKRDYFISFATNICYTKKHKRLAEKTPLEKILLETDSPWLDPDSPKTLTNRPWKIEKSAKIISEIKKIPFEKVIEITTKNAIELFNLPISLKF